MTDKFLDAALHYASRGWPVFPVSRSKLPFRGSHGHLDASPDAAAIERMWRGHAGANVALATGNLVVFDCDGADGFKAFKALGASPATLVARTPRGGLHFYYKAPAGIELRCYNAPRAVKGGPGLDIKAHGGFVLLPPSRDRSGNAYAWLREPPIALLPKHLLAYAQRAGGNRAPRVQLEPPPHLAGRASMDLVSAGLAGMGLDWSPQDEARIRTALKYIKESCGYDNFLKICASLHALNWVRGDGTDIGFELLNEWCQGFSERYNLDGLEYKWRSFRPDYRGARATVGTLFYLASEAGWDGSVKVERENESEVVQHSATSKGLGTRSELNGGRPPDKTQPLVPLTTEPGASFCPVDHDNVTEGTGNDPTVVDNPTHGMNGHAGATALLPALPPGLAIEWPDTDKGGNPKATCANTAVAITGLGIACRQDTFHERLLVGGQPIAQWAGDLTDNAVLMLRKVIWRAFAFDPGERHARDAAMQLCLEHPFNPVCEYLASLHWDGRPRIGRWTVDYLGAADTELNREFGRLMLIAAVRRARLPGCKFDQIVVLEGPQGAGKSSAIRILAGEDNFSDQHILGASDREQQEAFRGVWLHEIAELAGMRRTDVERVKQFARRTEDRARPAYGRVRQDMKRRGIFIATTNEEEYLKDYDRAFWPIAVGRIDLAGLIRDRDQLWAEAAACEARGDTIELAERLRVAAAGEQVTRREQDAWFEPIQGFLKARTQTDVSLHDLLTLQPLCIATKDINQTMQNRAARILKFLGYERKQERVNGKRQWRYQLSSVAKMDEW